MEERGLIAIAIAMDRLEAVFEVEGEKGAWLSQVEREGSGRAQERGLVGEDITESSRPVFMRAVTSSGVETNDEETGKGRKAFR